MQFRSIILILTCTVGVIASPVVEHQKLTGVHKPTAAPTNKYVEHYRKKVANGTIVYLGHVADAPGAKPIRTTQGVATKVQPRRETKTCKATATPVCDSQNAARNEICDQLVTELQGDSQIKIPSSAHQMCFEGAAAESNQYCCVSWQQTVEGLTKGDLAGNAYNIMQSCTFNGISGKMDSVKIHDTCTNLCLSNRGTGC